MRESKRERVGESGRESEEREGDSKKESGRESGRAREGER